MTCLRSSHYWDGPLSFPLVMAVSATDGEEPSMSYCLIQCLTAVVWLGLPALIPKVDAIIFVISVSDTAQVSCWNSWPVFQYIELLFLRTRSGSATTLNVVVIAALLFFPSCEDILSEVIICSSVLSIILFMFLQNLHCACMPMNGYFCLSYFMFVLWTCAFILKHL